MSLKKRITDFVNSLDVPESYPGMNADFAKLPDERRYEILDIIEEARKDFNPPNLEEWAFKEYVDKWFDKWFGEGGER